MIKPIKGFSKLTKQEKVSWIVSSFFKDNTEAEALIKRYWNDDDSLQQLHDEFIENTITNYYLPFGVAPNFLINEKLYTIPMAIEESSVVAAASKAAKFWLERGGFKTEVVSTTKVGQVHFMFSGDKSKLKEFFKFIKPSLISDAKHITANMEKRGGGIVSIDLVDKTEVLNDYFQLHCCFETLDAMGANFINSSLEQFANTFKRAAKSYDLFTAQEKDVEIVMSILSNYVPNCVVKAEVSCLVSELNEDEGMSADDFADKFVRAVQIAKVEPYRAVTHNKGIMNGVDAVVLATGNDFRAVEAGVHAYAARNGSYTSLTNASVVDGIFKFWIELPLALGTVGGLTNLHPLVKLALEMLGKPSAKELMQIIAVAALAQNFGALRSLTTTGIQKGHMKMHLMNILNQMGATAEEKIKVTDFFNGKTVVHSEVVAKFNELRLS
jgi:hydroxymethylglutaryl-CoA reductase